jgi:replicative DNA helicase
MKTQDEVAKSAEMCVIGTILIDEKALVNVIQTLKPEHFYFDELKAAYQAILELSSEGCVAARDESRKSLSRI